MTVKLFSGEHESALACLTSRFGLVSSQGEFLDSGAVVNVQGRGASVSVGFDFDVSVMLEVTPATGVTGVVEE